MFKEQSTPTRKSAQFVRTPSASSGRKAGISVGGPLAAGLSLLLTDLGGLRTTWWLVLSGGSPGAIGGPVIVQESVPIPPLGVALLLKPQRGSRPGEQRGRKKWRCLHVPASGGYRSVWKTG